MRWMKNKVNEINYHMVFLLHKQKSSSIKFNQYRVVDNFPTLLEIQILCYLLQKTNISVVLWHLEVFKYVP